MQPYDKICIVEKYHLFKKSDRYQTEAEIIEQFEHHEQQSHSYYPHIPHDLLLELSKI